MGSYTKFVLFIVALVILGAVVYAVSGQVGNGRFTFFSDFLKNHRDLLPSVPGGPSVGTSPAPVQVQNGTQSGESGSSGQPSQGSSPLPVVLPPGTQPPAGFTIRELSPYYKQVSISSISAARSVNDTSQFALQADYSLAGPVNVTGWVLKGYRGELARIPQASSLYQPTGATADADIILGKSGIVYVYGTRSPIGRNFRLNKCTGYLSNTYTFSPQLPQSCPAPYDHAEIVNFSATCQNFVSSLGNCRVPTSAELNQYSIYDNGACRTFLDRFSYTSCYNRHRGDSDFLSNEWRVWLVAGFLLDETHDHLTLYDRNGLLVNEYIY